MNYEFSQVEWGKATSYKKEGKKSGKATEINIKQQKAGKDRAHECSINRGPVL